MKHISIFTLTIFLVSLSMFGCKKGEDVNKLVGPSEGGDKNFLTCRINGKEYAFTGKPVGLNTTGVSYYYGLAGAGLPSYPLTRDFYVGGNDIGRLKAEVYLEFKNDTSYRIPFSQKIFIGNSGPNQQVFVSMRTEDYKDVYYYAVPGSGWIQFSRADSIGAGTFAFTAYSSTDTVVITDGRFDISR